MIKTAKKTFLNHIYTPIYKFEDNSKYDIVFNNPTNSILSIKVIFNNSNKKENLEIPSLGTKFLRFTKYKGSLSFESKLDDDERDVEEDDGNIYLLLLLLLLL